MIYWILFGAIALMSYLVQANLQRKFDKFSKVQLRSGLTGKDVAERMLQAHGIANVEVISTAGQLTDHFNPMNHTVNLSDGVYATDSVAAAAVAAHECGHAVQHAMGYAPLKLRSQLVPAVSFASKWVQWVLLAGVVLVEIFPALLAVGVGLFALTTLFSFVTLPVEIDASRRAVAWLETSGLTDATELPLAREALHAAAYTYVAAALGSLATLVYYVFVLMGRRDY